MRRNWPAILALIFLTFAAHWRVLQNGFVNYDDNDYVTANPLIQRGLTLDGLAWAFGNLHGEKTYWHPLTWVSHMLDCQLFGLNPIGHHATSLLLHGLNVVLLFLVFQRMTGAFWRSAMLAALWAVHPLQVDTVAWVTERKNILAALFWILSMGAYVRYAEKPGWGRYALVVAGMALGLMCKPVLVTLPCALLLLDFWPLRRIRRSAEASSPALPEVSFARAALEKVPLLALSLIAAFITLQAHNALGIRQDITGLTTGLKIQNAFVSYLRYLDHTVWPAGLNVLYLHPGKWPGWRVGLSAAFLLILTALAMANFRQRPFLLVGWLWFFGVLVPTIGLRQAGMQAMADRFMYLPLIGVLLLIVWTAADWITALRRPGWTAAALATPALALLVLAANFQAATWRNSFTLWQQALAANPDNFIAHNNVAFAWLAAGRLDRAREHATAAARLRPGYTAPLSQLAVISLQERKPVEAVQYYHELIRLQPGSVADLNDLAWLRATHPDDAARDGAEAVRLAERACELTRRQVAFLIGTLAAAYAEAGRFEDAVKAGEEAARVARAAGQEQLAATNEHLLTFYRARKPFRQQIP